MAKVFDVLAKIMVGLGIVVGAFLAFLVGFSGCIMVILPAAFSAFLFYAASVHFQNQEKILQYLAELSRSLPKEPAEKGARPAVPATTYGTRPAVKKKESVEPWECPYCGTFNEPQYRACTKCNKVKP